MRSIAIVRGRQFVNRWRSQLASSNSHHNIIHQHQHNYWLQQLHAFSTVSDTSTDTSFHGLSLDGKKDKKTTTPKHTHYNSPSPPTNNSNQIIQDAQVVFSDEEKQRTHESIKEVARAELSAHSISSLEDDNTTLDSPYDRRLMQLNEAQLCHESIDEQQSISYAKSCMNMGQLHYQLGHMQDSQDMYLNALQTLMNNTSDNNDDNGDTQPMIAKCMHSLGAIHARLGEFDEAFQWYEESLKNKQQILDEGGDDINRNIYYELGLSYNGLASLEVIKGGEVQCERALSGFQEAERNYLLVYADVIDFQGDGSSTTLTKETLEQILPHHLASLVSVRSNMGELLRQRGQYPQAVEKFRLALDIAKTSLEITHESNSCDQVVDGPSLDEQRNKIVDIQLMIADTFMHAKCYDDAAETYEQALNSHTYFRRWNSQDDNSHRSVLPTTIPDATRIEYDIKCATSVEAAIRSNLANALSQIGQERLAEKHFTASLAMKRKFGGDHHLEVAHELMALGALNGGPLRDFTKALTCFKEALYIFRANLEESSTVHDSSSSQVFFGDDDSAMIDKHIQNALKNISLIDAALLKDRDGGRKQISER